MPVTDTPQRPDRNAILERLRTETFDVVIVGGGVTGAWIARDAVMRGLSVALVEKNDFASGTSSRSSRFVHGGLRYLRHRHVGLVREGLRERGLLLRLAPHLVHPFPFVLPVFESGRDSPLILRIGLAGYDLLAGTMGIGRHRWRPRDKLIYEEPAILQDGLRGGYSYYDAITDDSRLTLTVALSAIERGAAVANYVEAVSWEKSGERVSAVNCRDVVSGDEFTVRARVVIGAAGPWTDQLRAFDSEPPVLRPSKGVHVVMPRELIPTNAIIAFFWKDRPLFAVPAGRYMYVGTTDTDWSGDPGNAATSADDVSYIIDAVHANFSSRIKPSDITSAWAGVRPLVAEEGSPTTSDVSRDYEVLDGPPGVHSIAGGKLTSARLMAEAMLDHVIEKDGAFLSRKPARCRTQRTPLPGAVSGFDRYRTQTTADLVRSWGMTEPAAQNLIGAYGTRLTRVLAAAAHNEGLISPACEGSDELLVQAAYTAGDEMTVTLEDFMRRRSNLMLFSPDNGLPAVDAVVGVLAAKLGWNAAHKKEQIAAYKASIDHMMAFSQAAAVE